MTGAPLPAQGIRGVLERQLAVGWQLARWHLDSLTTEECLWRPATRGLHVHRQADGTWSADWPETQGYELGPSSIGWLTWHFGFWWSMALDHNFGAGTLTREAVRWPGDAALVRAWIADCQERWSALLRATSEQELARSERVRWPFQGRPLADLFAWGNTELVKSAAEIGYARFSYAAR